MQKTVSRRAYIAIDLKSFYASVECVERGLDPLTTNLVVANPSRTEKTICLAVSPPLKSYGVPGRPRLFEVIQRIREVNEERRRRAPGRQFRDKSWRNEELKADPSLAVSYLVAPPRMAHYMKWSTQIYQIYLRYVAPEDIHVYSIDEVFMDVTEYLGIYKVSPRELAKRIIRTVLEGRCLIICIVFINKSDFFYLISGLIELLKYFKYIICDIFIDNQLTFMHLIVKAYV